MECSSWSVTRHDAAIVSALQDGTFEIIATNFSEEQEQRLRDAFAQD